MTHLAPAALALALAACATVGPDAPRVSRTPPAAATLIGVPASRDAGSLMVQNATAMLGHPYRYGGAAPEGFDCSGLVVYAASGAGLHVPRTAHEQLGAGVAIGRHEVRAGDLVFMHLARKELHVGIAIDGNRFVHAPSTGGRVRIDSLSAAPYARGFLGARRIANAAP